MEAPHAASSAKGHERNDWPVIDFFSGCGGMSCGFVRRPPFRLLAAVDAEMAKPCEGFGKLGCNSTYAANIGIKPTIERTFSLMVLPSGRFNSS